MRILNGVETVAGITLAGIPDPPPACRQQVGEIPSGRKEDGDCPHIDNRNPDRESRHDPGYIPQKAEVAHLKVYTEIRMNTYTPRFPVGVS
jgi:hypothetical protein